MSRGRSFAAWNIFDSGLTRDAIGHHYWETRTLADELIRTGAAVRLFTHRDAPTPEQFPGVEIVPTFSLYLYFSVTNDPAWSGIESFIVHNRAFHGDLARLEPALVRDSVALFPTVGHKQLLGLFRWMGSFPAGSGPDVAACLMAPKEWSAANDTLRLYKMISDRCPPGLKEKIALFSRTSQIARMFSDRIGLRSGVFPLVIPEHERNHLSGAASPPGEPAISYLGGSRRERGADLIADAVRRCAASGVRFLIQAQAGSDAGFDIGKLTALGQLPNVRVLQGTLSRDEYYDALSGTVALLPYHPMAYRWDDSSVYHEAKLLDVPVLVTEGTWMADEVRSLGNGLVIRDFTSAAIAESVLRALQDLPALRANAARAGENFRQAQGVARCLAAVEEAIKDREFVAQARGAAP